MDKFWKFVKNEAKESELILEGVVASESWWGDEVTPKQFREELAKHTGNINVRINSPGGDVFAGVAIYNMLKDRNDGQITVIVDGLAASIASVIAMAGDKIIMNTGSAMMVHKPWTIAVGNDEELKAVANELEKIGEAIVPIYTARTGLSETEVMTILEGEKGGDGTWMTGEEAVDLGFADEFVEGKTKLSDAIANALSNIKNVQSAIMQPAMSLKTKLEDEVKQAINQSKETDMDQEAIAKAQVIEPAKQADPAVAPKQTVKDYLKTNEAMEAFAQLLESNPATKDNAAQVSASIQDQWKKHLETKMGVTNPEIFYPQPLITTIEDAFKTSEIWSRVSKTGLDVFPATWDANDDPDAESGRAAGYNRAEEEEKREQSLTFANRILRPQMIYKYITLNAEDIKEQRSTGALVRFVLSELPVRIIREVERAIVTGDGRAPGSDYKIQEGTPRGFYPVKADAAAGNVFASTYTPVPGQTVYETLRRARALIKADGEVLLVAKEGLLLDMEFEQNVNGGFLFAPGSDMSRYIKVSAVVEPDWMENDENDAYMFVTGKYRVVGDQSVEAFTNFLLKTNKYEYLQEIWAGGGLTARKSGVAVAPQATS